MYIYMYMHIFRHTHLSRWYTKVRIRKAKESRMLGALTIALADRHTDYRSVRKRGRSFFRASSKESWFPTARSN